MLVRRANVEVERTKTQVKERYPCREGKLSCIECDYACKESIHPGKEDEDSGKGAIFM